VAAVGTDPDDFIHTGHVNDLLARYEMTSDHVVQKVVALLSCRKGRRA
jgi:transketolase C-terminal domain/subunit